ncbi:MAG: hypothetical protein A2Y14_01665 [Verrucomicrobia bacterium GWF2_51_19]|nr:MAG: hypothetical protein A2Y14_01665 [Verrucomicrobia bacterium GWF2_51_19]HCJ11523.1 hypothetical protein [Opitutae bacterium]
MKKTALIEALDALLNSEGGSICAEHVKAALTWSSLDDQLKLQVQSILDQTQQQSLECKALLASLKEAIQKEAKHVY